MAAADAATAWPDATDVGYGMSGLREVRMLAGVTCEAMGVSIFCRGFGGIEDFGRVAVAVDVGFAVTVAAFAGYGC